MFTAPAFVQAGGIQLPGGGVRQAGMGGAGAAFARDAATLWLNPGAMPFLRRSQLSLGGIGMQSHSAWIGLPPAVDIYRTQNATRSPLHAFGVWRSPGRRWALGAGINQPFSQSVQWPEVWPGMYISQSAALRSHSLHAAAGLRIGQHIGIGAALMRATTAISYQNALDIGTLDNGVPSSMFLQAHGSAWGARAGIFYQPNERLSTGLSWSSGLAHAPLRGNAEFNVPLSWRPFFAPTVIEIYQDLPASLTFALAYAPQPSLRLALDLRYTYWAGSDSIVVDYQTETHLLQDAEKETGFRNAPSLRVGAEWQPIPAWMLRAGLYFEGTPVSDGFVSPAFPGANGLGATAGLSFSPVETLNLHLSFGAETTGERLGALLGRGFAGTYQTYTFALGLGIDLNF